MKVWNYVFLSVGLIVLLQMAGLPNGAGGQLLDAIGLTFNVDNTVATATPTAAGFFQTLFGENTGLLTALLASAGAVLVGLFTKAKPENLILLPLITGTLVLFLSTFTAIMSYSIANSATWVSAVMVLFLLPFSVLFILSLAEFFRGTD